MKKLALAWLVTMVCGAALAQNTTGRACENVGDFSQIGDEVFNCSPNGWVKFSALGEKTVKITYSLSEGEKTLNSGFLVTRDGKPASHAERKTTSYVSEATKDATGKLLLTQSTVVTGTFMTFTPVLVEDGMVKMYLSVSDSVLNSLDTVSSGDLSIQTPDVRKVDSTQSLVMVMDKEAIIPLEGSAQNGNAHYTLKLIVSSI